MSPSLVKRLPSMLPPLAARERLSATATSLRSISWAALA
jgi:hypothetical protein